MGKEKIILIGGGGHCKVIIDAIRKAGEYEIEGIVDPELRVDDEVSGVPVFGDDSILPELFNSGIKNAFIGVGSTGDCQARKRLYQTIKGVGFNSPVIIHPKAVIAEDVEIHDGVFIAAGAIINPGVRVGENSIINTRSSVDHDCRIGKDVHIAPGATLSGGVEVGDETHIGTGSNITQYVKIGKGCFIRSGALVSKNMADGEKHG